MPDWNATHFGYPGSVLDPDILAAFVDALHSNCNAYGMHCGRGSQPLHGHRIIEEDALGKLASFIGLPKNSLGYLASGATEAAIIASWAARKLGVSTVVHSSLAHNCLRKGIDASGLPARVIAVEGALRGETLRALHDSRQLDYPILLCLTWWNPLLVDTDDVRDTLEVARTLPGQIFVYVDGAVGAVLSPLLTSSTLHDLPVDVIGVDLHKTAGAPVGTGLVMYSPRVRAAISITDDYLPYSEDCTLIGSRNAASAFATMACVNKISDGTLRRDYGIVCNAARRLLSNAGIRIIRELPSYLLVELGKAAVDPEITRELSRHDVAPWNSDGRYVARLCLSPRQSLSALARVIELLRYCGS